MKFNLIMLGYDVLWLLVHFGSWGYTYNEAKFGYWNSLKFVHILGLFTVILEIGAKIGLAYIINQEIKLIKSPTE